MNAFNWIFLTASKSRKGLVGWCWSGKCRGFSHKWKNTHIHPDRVEIWKQKSLRWLTFHVCISLSCFLFSLSMMIMNYSVLPNFPSFSLAISSNIRFNQTFHHFCVQLDGRNEEECEYEIFSILPLCFNFQASLLSSIMRESAKERRKWKFNLFFPVNVVLIWRHIHTRVICIRRANSFRFHLECQLNSRRCDFTYKYVFMVESLSRRSLISPIRDPEQVNLKIWKFNGITTKYTLGWDRVERKGLQCPRWTRNWVKMGKWISSL